MAATTPLMQADPGLNHRVRIMGILNLTPDSFSDGGHLSSEKELLARAEKMLAAGVDIFDIGGESTRPMASAVSAEEELRRVIPAIKALGRLESDIPISIDTTKAVVAAEAIAAGASIINDISALEADPEMPKVAAAGDWPVIIMHRQGTPRDMQLAPRYDDVVAEISAYLAGRITDLQAQGIARRRLIVDPGIGFGKTLAHNLEILRHLADFKALGQPLLLGHSRKSWLTGLLGEMEPAARDLPSAVVSALAVGAGVDIIRTHNVEATRQAIQLAQTLAGGETRQPARSPVDEQHEP